jgi:hypothetical protein
MWRIHRSTLLQHLLMPFRTSRFHVSFNTLSEIACCCARFWSPECWQVINWQLRWCSPLGLLW